MVAPLGVKGRSKEGGREIDNITLQNTTDFSFTPIGLLTLSGLQDMLIKPSLAQCKTNNSTSERLVLKSSLVFIAGFELHVNVHCHEPSSLDQIYQAGKHHVLLSCHDAFI